MSYDVIHVGLNSGGNVDADDIRFTKHQIIEIAFIDRFA